MTKSNKNLSFFTVNEIEGSLLMCESVEGIVFGEIVRIITQDGKSHSAKTKG